MTTPLILKGDKRDSSRQFQDRLRELKTTYNMQAFMNEDIDAEEPYSGQDPCLAVCFLVLADELSQL